MSYCNLYPPPPIMSNDDYRFQILDQTFSEFQENANEVKQNLSSISEEHGEIRQKINKLNQQMDRRAESSKKHKNDFKISKIKENISLKSIAIGALALMIITGTIAAIFGSYLLSAPFLVVGTAGIIKYSLSIAEDVKIGSATDSLL